MIELLRQMFATEKIEACVTQTNNSVIEIYDCYDCEPQTKRSHIRTDIENPVHFTLHNINNLDVWFAAVDNCLLGTTDAMRCDFMIGNAFKIYFVEIKQVNTKQRRKARTEAIEQLHAAIAHFTSYIVKQVMQAKLIAVICIKAKQAYPLQNATRGAERLAFIEKYNADLLEGQSAVF